MSSLDLVIFALIFSEFGYVPDYFYVPNFFYVFKSLCSKKHKFYFWHLEKPSVFKFLCSKKHKYFFWHLDNIEKVWDIEKIWNIAKFRKNQGKNDWVQNLTLRKNLYMDTAYSAVEISKCTRHRGILMLFSNIQILLSNFA